MKPEISINSDTLSVRFDRFDIEAYDVFLQIKRLPEYRLDFDRQASIYTVSAPARFAPLLGIEAAAADREWRPLPTWLYDDQQAIVMQALEGKRFACWSDCGLGKTLIGLEVARQIVHRTGGRVLIVTLNEIVGEWVQQAIQFYHHGLPIVQLESRDEMKLWCATGNTLTSPMLANASIAITNYEKFNHKTEAEQVVSELRHLGGIVLDECFAAGTLVDCIENGQLIRKAIENIRLGDIIANAIGMDAVADVHRREVPYAVRVRINGKTVVTSPNHPWFTRRGWVGSQDMLPGDYCVPTSEAVCILRGAIHDQVQELGSEAMLRLFVRGKTKDVATWGEGESGNQSHQSCTVWKVPMLRRGVPSALEVATEEILQSILLSEVADVTAGTFGESSQPDDIRQDISQPHGVHEVPSGKTTGGIYSQAKPDIGSGGSGEDIPPIESHPAQTFRAWGQREGLNGSADDLAGCTRIDLAGGISFVTGPTDGGLSNALQTRLSDARSKNRYRGGWSQPSLPEGGGPEEGHQARLARVEGIEILEPGHPELESLRDADGKLYFYDLGATRHPSFSVNGILVHNSSRLKTGGGKQKWALIKSARGIEFKLSLTATPAPNEIMEFASQASFLEKMRSDNEIIWTYFRRDEKTHRWTVKPHARAAFFEFMASWSIYVRDPRKYGWRMDIERPPEPEYFTHTIATTAEQRQLVMDLNADSRNVPEASVGTMFAGQLNAISALKLSEAAKGFIYENVQRPVAGKQAKPRRDRASTDKRRGGGADAESADVLPDDPTAGLLCEGPDAGGAADIGDGEDPARSRTAKGTVRGLIRSVRRIDSNKPNFVADLIRSEARDRGLNTLVWCVFDEEIHILTHLLRGSAFAAEVAIETLNGATKKADRPAVIERFKSGATRVLIARADMLGYGMNFQHVGSMVFSGWTFSYEQFYQAVRRAVRHGQKQSVRVHMPIVPELEGQMWDAIVRKQGQHEEAVAEMEANYIKARGVFEAAKGAE